MKTLLLLVILAVASTSSHRHHRHHFDSSEDDNFVHSEWWHSNLGGTGHGRGFEDSDDEKSFDHSGRWRPWEKRTTTESSRVTYPIFSPTSTTTTERFTTSESIPDAGSSTVKSDNLVIESCVAACQSTPEQNPVCGTDNITYPNIGKLECARMCGVAVSLRRSTSCFAPVGPTDATLACIQTCSVTSEYNPVCGTDNVTYPNPGSLECAINCGLEIQLSRRSSCSVPPGPNNPDLRGSTDRPNGNGNGNGKPNGNGNWKGNGNWNGNGNPNGNGNWNGNGNGNGNGNTNGNGNKTPTMTEVIACMQLCPITSEINLVCGTDGVTYSNPGKLLCTQFCGIDVRVQKFAPCSGNQIACPTVPTTYVTTQDCINKCVITQTQEFKPVCGTNGVTYINIESLQCMKNCGVDVSLKSLSACLTSPPIDGNKNSTTEKSDLGFTTPVDIKASVLPEINVPTQPTTSNSDESYEIDIKFGEAKN